MADDCDQEGRWSSRFVALETRDILRATSGAEVVLRLQQTGRWRERMDDGSMAAQESHVRVLLVCALGASGRERVGQGVGG